VHKRHGARVPWEFGPILSGYRPVAVEFEAPLIIVVEINFALWIMIACLAIKASELVQALS